VAFSVMVIARHRFDTIWMARTIDSGKRAGAPYDEIGARSMGTHSVWSPKVLRRESSYSFGYTYRHKLIRIGEARARVSYTECCPPWALASVCF